MNKQESNSLHVQINVDHGGTKTDFYGFEIDTQKPVTAVSGMKLKASIYNFFSERNMSDHLRIQFFDDTTQNVREQGFAVFTGHTGKPLGPEDVNELRSRMSTCLATGKEEMTSLGEAVDHIPFLSSVSMDV